jgi:hypothetical protein
LGALQVSALVARTNAPPGTSDGDLELRLAEPEDDMSDDELVLLNEALAQGFEQIKAGQFRSATDVIADLRRR